MYEKIWDSHLVVDVARQAPLLLVELEQGRDLFDLGELFIDLQALLKRKVDLVTKDSLHPHLYSRVVNEARPS